MNDYSDTLIHIRVVMRDGGQTVADYVAGTGATRSVSHACCTIHSYSWIVDGCAGGVAGVVSRTAVSPLERMKILFMVGAHSQVRCAHGKLCTCSIGTRGRPHFIRCARGADAGCVEPGARAAGRGPR
jgi:hypothetical protein